MEDDEYAVSNLSSVFINVCHVSLQCLSTVRRMWPSLFAGIWSTTPATMNSTTLTWVHNDLTISSVLISFGCFWMLNCGSLSVGNVWDDASQPRRESGSQSSRKRRVHRAQAPSHSVWHWPALLSHAQSRFLTRPWSRVAHQACYLWSYCCVCQKAKADPRPVSPAVMEEGHAKVSDIMTSAVALNFFQ